MMNSFLEVTAQSIPEISITVPFSFLVTRSFAMFDHSSWYSMAFRKSPSMTSVKTFINMFLLLGHPHFARINCFSRHSKKLLDLISFHDYQSSSCHSLFLKTIQIQEMWLDYRGNLFCCNQLMLIQCQLVCDGRRDQNLPTFLYPGSW